MSPTAYQVLRDLYSILNTVEQEAFESAPVFKRLRHRRLMHNEVVKSDIHSTDAFGFSE